VCSRWRSAHWPAEDGIGDTGGHHQGRGAIATFAKMVASPCSTPVGRAKDPREEILVSTLADAGRPLEWAATMLAHDLSRLRTAALAEMTGRSMPAARAELGRITRAGWLEPRGATRGRWCRPSEQPTALTQHVPELMHLPASGEQPSLFDEALACWLSDAADDHPVSADHDGTSLSAPQQH
jgi:hypothetical protein